MTVSGHPGSVRGPHEHQQRTGLRFRGEDCPAHVLLVSSHRTGRTRVGGRDIHRCRRIPGVPEGIAKQRHRQKPRWSPRLADRNVLNRPESTTNIFTYLLMLIFFLLTNLGSDHQIWTYSSLLAIVYSTVNIKILHCVLYGLVPKQNGGIVNWTRLSTRVS